MRQKRIKREKKLLTAMEQIVTSDHYKRFKENHPEKEKPHLVFDDYMYLYMSGAFNKKE